MNVFDIDGTISKPEWDIAHLYTTLIIRRKGEPRKRKVSARELAANAAAAPPQKRSATSTAAPSHRTGPISPTTPDYEPDGTPNSNAGGFAPTSPDWEPEDEGPSAPKAPTSPDWDPEDEGPSAPDTSEGFAPCSPEADPDDEVGGSDPIAPTTPDWEPEDSSPNVASGGFAPCSPEGNPDDEVAPLDPVQLMLKTRSIAVGMAGGEANWNNLPEDSRNILMAEAKKRI
jgi:hypothetical protein